MQGQAFREMWATLINCPVNYSEDENKGEQTKFLTNLTRVKKMKSLLQKCVARDINMVRWSMNKIKLMGSELTVR